jgi:hypothetical protein
MANQLQSIAIQAPGFYGLNTEDSPTALSQEFALEADNCVIDAFGRVGARKGYRYLTETNPAAIKSMSEFIKSDGTTEIISASDTNIFRGVTTLEDITPVGYAVSDGYYDAATLNDKHYLFRKGSAPLVYDGTTAQTIQSHSDVSGTVLEGNIVTAAYGRLWIANSNDNQTTIYWSDLLNGLAWNTGSAGYIDVSKVWAGGSDTIEGVAAHNGFLIIFGRKQILVYQGAEDPATMKLADTIVGIGCICRDSIAKTGQDLIFLSDTGVRSLNRTIQEKSIPITDLSKNIRTELNSYIDNVEGKRTVSVYSPEEAFYLMHIPDADVSYCFDLRQPLQDGSYRVTKWDSINPISMLRTRLGELYMGKENGIAVYDGYLDDSSPYRMSYFSNYLDFGAPSNLKILKNLKMTVIGGSATDVILNWGYDYSYNYKKKKFTLSTQIISEYNIAEYNEGEFNGGVLVNRPTVNASGGGQVIQLGIIADVNGAPVSIQRLTAQATIGRTI